MERLWFWGIPLPCTWDDEPCFHIHFLLSMLHSLLSIVLTSIYLKWKESSLISNMYLIFKILGWFRCLCVWCAIASRDGVMEPLNPKCKESIVFFLSEINGDTVDHKYVSCLLQLYNICMWLSTFCKETTLLRRIRFSSCIFNLFFWICPVPYFFYIKFA